MPRPNILLITTDQHNAEIMGCAGNPVVRTPNLDRLAADGVLFESAYSPHPLCTPARTSILTGQYSRHHGVPYNINTNEFCPDPPDRVGLRSEAVAFPEILSRAGYATALFGKLHTKQVGERCFGLQTLSLAEGKGQFIEHGSPPDDYRRYLKGKGYPDASWRTWEQDDYGARGYARNPLPEEDTIDGWTATQAIDYIEQANGPFFTWVSFSNPHTPWDPPQPYDRLYDPHSIPMPTRRRGELEQKHEDWVDLVARTIPARPAGSTDRSAPRGTCEAAYARFSDRQIREMLAAYYGEITHIDTQVGRVLDALKARGLDDETLVVFTADHGDYLGNNWAFFKQAGLYESLIRVPTILRWPGRAQANLRRSELVSLIDLAPTILEAAQLATVDPMDGRSLVPLLQGEPASWRDELCVEMGRTTALLTEEHKYVRWDDGFEELYQRRIDPHDLYNRASSPQSVGMCREMAERLRRW